MLETIITAVIVCSIFNLTWDGVKYALTARKMRKYRRAELAEIARAYVVKFDPLVLVKEHDVIRLQTQVLPFFRVKDWHNEELWGKKKILVTQEISKLLGEVVDCMKKYHQHEMHKDSFNQAVHAYTQVLALVSEL